MALDPTNPEAARFMEPRFTTPAALASWEKITQDVIDADYDIYQYDYLWNPDGCYVGKIVDCRILAEGDAVRMEIHWNKHQGQPPIIEYLFGDDELKKYWWLNWMLDPEFGKCACGGCPSWESLCRE